MSSDSGGPTINQGPAPEADREPAGEVAGNVREKKEDPSPDDRDRGETASSDESGPAGLDPVRERAS